MANSRVWKDEHGIYIKTGGYVFRPGGIRGYDHAYDMDDGGLKEGDTVKAHHMSQTRTAKLVLADGTFRHWGNHDVDDPDRNENIVPLTAEQKQAQKDMMSKIFGSSIKRIVKVTK